MKKAFKGKYNEKYSDLDVSQRRGHKSRYQFKDEEYMYIDIPTLLEKKYIYRQNKWSH